MWKHRRDGETDIYFVSNQKYEERTEELSFRVTDKQPELWRPDSGIVASVPFELVDGRTRLSLHFDPAGSVFIVFGRNTPNLEQPARELPKIAEISGPWQVAFPGQTVVFDTLVSWTEKSDPAVKYYAGTATYKATFTLGDVDSITVLDLGVVDEMARVRVNGQDAGTLWKPPYTVDISGLVKAGDNTLEIDVVNTWLNRLVGDAQPGVQNPGTFTTTKSWNADTPLEPAGLLGPVVLRGGEYGSP